MNVDRDLEDSLSATLCAPAALLISFSLFGFLFGFSL